MTTLEWLLHPLTTDDIRTGYDFSVQCPDYPIVVRLGLISEILSIGERHGPPPYVQYRFEVYKADKSSVLDFPAERHLLLEEQLFQPTEDGRERRGKVVHNRQFFVDRDYQKMGIASTVYELEEKLYRRWGALEIQLAASASGKVVWRWFGFDVPKSELLMIEARYEEWCAEQGVPYLRTMDILKYPESFLLSRALIQYTMFKGLS